MREIIIEVSNAVELKSKKVAANKSSIWEDNEDCRKIANLEMPHMTPRSKHYAVKYHWFQTHLEPNGIVIERVNSEENIADLFTKGLLGEKIKTLCRLLC